MPRSVKIGSLIAIAVASAGTILFLSGNLAEGSKTTAIDPSKVRMFVRGDYAIGVGTHLSAKRNLGYETKPVINVIDSFGFNSFRDGVAWEPNTPGLGAQPRPKLAAILQAKVARPLLLLAGQMGGPGSAPTDPAGRAGYATFATKAVDGTIALSPIYEIWNEWNRTANYKAKAMTTEGQPDDPRYSGQYAQLARTAVSAIKSQYPNAKVVVGAAAEDMQWAWLSDVVRQGGLTQADGLSIHLYNQCNRWIRGSDELIARMRKLEGMVQPMIGRAVNIYVTEWGWSTGKACQVNSDFVAANSAQFMFAAATLPYVKGTWQYELKDEGGDPNDLEASFGILDAQYRPKPSTCAVQGAAKLLRSVQSIGTAYASDGVTVIFAQTKNDHIAIVWDSKDRGSAKIRIAGSSVRAESVCGTAQNIAAGQLTSVRALPTILHFGTSFPTMSLSGI